MSRSSRVKGKRKLEAKKARTAAQRRTVSLRVQFDRRVEDPSAGNRGTNESRNNAGFREAVALGPGATSKMIEFPAAYSGAGAPAVTALQAWFLLPLRNLLTWHEMWIRLLPH